MKRESDHEPRGASILDAYLHTESPLTQAIRTFKLQSLTGPLVASDNQVRAAKHLEIIGEISIDVVWEDVQIRWSGLQKPWNSAPKMQP